MEKKTVAFIPARGGSKSIPLKNIKIIAGKPLIYWTIAAAAALPAIEKVYVSTDSDEIASCVRDLNISSKVEVISRSSESATDTASSELPLLEFCRNVTFDYVFFIQATSPLLSTDDLDNAWQKYQTNNYDSLLSVVRQKRFIWEEREAGDVQPVNYDPVHRPRRQEFNGFLVENGAFYLNGRQNILAGKNRITGKIGVYEMAEETYVELDEPLDWIIIENLLLKRNLHADSRQKKLAQIKLLAMDVDGVLTDAGMYYSEGGEELKKFHTRDGKGIELIRNAGIKTAIITSENTRMVERRAQKLKIDYLFQGALDKGPVIKELSVLTGIPLANIAYIGDDDNDLVALELAGISASPSDATDGAKNRADFILSRNGGGGAVRELCDMILRSRQHVEGK